MVVNANFASNLVAGFLFSVWILNSLFPTETCCCRSDFFLFFCSFVSEEHGNSTRRKKRLLNSEHISFCQYPLTIALSHSTILCVILKPKYSLHFGFGFISVAHFLDIFLSISLLKAAFHSSESELTHSLSSCIAHTPKNRLSANLALNYEIWHLNISIFSDRIQWEIQIDSMISLSTCKLHISKCFEVCWMNSEFLLCVCVDGEELKRTEFHWIGVLKFDVILWVTERKKIGGKIFGK